MYIYTRYLGSKLWTTEIFLNNFDKIWLSEQQLQNRSSAFLLTGFLLLTTQVNGRRGEIPAWLPCRQSVCLPCLSFFLKYWMFLCAKRKRVHARLTVSVKEGKTNIQTDRQTDRYSDIQTDRQTTIIINLYFPLSAIDLCSQKNKHRYLFCWHRLKWG